jgi:hypothetical protein
MIEPIHTLAVAARRLLAVHCPRRAVRDDPNDPASLDPEAFLADWSALLAKLPPGVVRRHALVAVPVDRPPWTDAELELAAGDRVTIFGAGRAWLSRRLDLWVGPQFQLWARVGEAGPIFNGPRDHHSFVSERAGRLSLGSYFPGQWGDPSGRISTDLGAYRGIEGGLAAAVLVWGDAGAEAGLDALAAAGDVAGLAAAERARLAAPVEPPEGWRPLWLIGRSEIFRAEERDGRRTIACHVQRNVGILQRDVSLPFEPGTRLRWSWRIDALPSELPEDTALTHDYVSIAVEFSDGRDITYTWSRRLRPGHSYWCPLPTWKDREHHVVVRSGTEGLGGWHGEERDLHADHAARMGPPPARIVRVWLIAVGLFQRLEGRCWFADLELVQGEQVVRVL